MELADPIDTTCVWFAGLWVLGVQQAQEVPLGKAEALLFHTHLGLVFQLVGRSYKLFSKMSVSS